MIEQTLLLKFFQNFSEPFLHIFHSIGHLISFYPVNNACFEQRPLLAREQIKEESSFHRFQTSGSLKRVRLGTVCKLWVCDNTTFLGSASDQVLLRIPYESLYPGTPGECAKHSPLPHPIPSPPWLRLRQQKGKIRDWKVTCEIHIKLILYPWLRRLLSPSLRNCSSPWCSREWQERIPVPCQRL